MEVANVTGVVTGGAAGLGKALAETLLQGGARVAITDINAAQLAATGDELRATFGDRVATFQQDVTDPDSFHATLAFAAEQFGRKVNLLVNNAGIPSDSRFHRDGAEWQHWQAVINTNLVAVIRGTQVAADVMKKTLADGEEGVIVNMASIAGIVDFPFAPTYAAAKAGVVHFTRSMVPLKKNNNIRVVALCPGFADTVMGRAGMMVWPQIETTLGKLLPLDAVGAGLVQLLRDADNAGRALRVVDGETKYYSYADKDFFFPNEDVFIM
jgi:NAD(P)-dependent dehydrogenase (short-subunit alcohol dehydrogenase family)